MKDYESYINNGNAEVPEYSKELSIEYFDLRDNNLPGEEMDSFENSLACGINTKGAKSFQSSSQGKTLDDVQELTNALTPTSSSIVESAGVAITGTAAAVVGSAAAVIAFNAVPKIQPKMVINALESGATYVYYDLQISNLDLNKDYDIVISNNRQEFRIDCYNGKNEQYVYDLQPGYQYSLSLVGYNELLGEITYVTKNFYTFDSDKVNGYSNIDIIYNDDFTCGIKYDTKLIDDKDAVDETYIVIRVASSGGAENEDWIIFHSLYLEEFSREQEDMFTYNYENKVHSGTIKEVPEGTIYIDLYKIGPEDEKDNGELIATTSKEVVYPLNEQTGANYVEIKGNYNLVKNVKNIDVKKENFVVKLTLYNDEGIETKIEKDIYRTSGRLYGKMLVKQDTTAYSYQVGYYDNDNNFVVLKEKEKQSFYGGYYDGYFQRVIPNDEDYINVKWKYDDDGNEVADITLLTDFDNYGNQDAYYRVELLRHDYDWDTNSYVYTIVDTYEGTENAVFKNVPIGEFNEEYNRYTDVYEYTFRYVSIMNYYNEEKGIEKVEVEINELSENDGYLDLEPIISVSMGDFMLLSSGKYAIEMHSPHEENISDILYDNSNVSLTMHFFKDNVNQVTQKVEVENVSIQSANDMSTFIVIDQELPTGMVGYYVEYNIPYYERYGGNIRTLKTNGKFLMGDISCKVAPTSIYCGLGDEVNQLKINLIGYMPSGYTIKAIDNDENEYDLTKVNNEYLFEEYLGTEASVRFDVYNGSEAVTYYAYSYDPSYAQYKLDSLSIVDIENENMAKNNVVYTYNDDGTININLITDYGNNEPDLYDFYVDYMLNKQVEGGAYQGIAEVNGSRDGIVRFNNVDSTLVMNDYDTFYIDMRIGVSYKNVPIDGCQEIISFAQNSSIDFTGSNMSSLTDYYPLDMAHYVNDYDNNRKYAQLSIPNAMAFDLSQTVVLNGNDNGNDLDPYYIDLSTAEVIESADSIMINFNLPESFATIIDYGQGTVTVDVLYNYTLTKEKLEKLGNNYSGNLYDKLTLSVSMA